MAVTAGRTEENDAAKAVKRARRSGAETIQAGRYPQAGAYLRRVTAQFPENAQQDAPLPYLAAAEWLQLVEPGNPANRLGWARNWRFRDGNTNLAAENDDQAARGEYAAARRVSIGDLEAAGPAQIIALYEQVAKLDPNDRLETAYARYVQALPGDEARANDLLTQLAGREPGNALIALERARQAAAGGEYGRMARELSAAAAAPRSLSRPRACAGMGHPGPGRAVADPGGNRGPAPAAVDNDSVAEQALLYPAHGRRRWDCQPFHHCGSPWRRRGRLGQLAVALIRLRGSRGQMQIDVRRSPKMKLAFSTLGCPEWNLDQIISAAQASAYEGIEWRGYQAEMDLPNAPIFTARARGETRRRVQDAGLEFVCLGSSVRLADSEPAVRAREKAAFARYAELSRFLGCPWVRVFGGSLSSGASRDAALPLMAEFLRELADIAAENDIAVILETHDDFSSGVHVAELLRRTNHPSAGALWDLHHPYRQGEPPETSVQVLAPYLRHTHVKDSRADGSYCLMGEGDVPLERMIGLLRAQGYGGWISLEWEKRWHPEIAPPEEVFPQYAHTLRALISGD